MEARKKQITLYVDIELYKKLKHDAIDQETSLQKYIIKKLGGSGEEHERDNIDLSTTETEVSDS